MKKRLNSSEPKDDAVSFTAKTNFIKRLKNSRIRFNPKPSKKTETNKQLEKKDIVDSQLEIEKEIDVFFKQTENKKIIDDKSLPKEPLEIFCQESTEKISEPIEINQKQPDNIKTDINSDYVVDNSDFPDELSKTKHPQDIAVEPDFLQIGDESQKPIQDVFENKNIPISVDSGKSNFMVTKMQAVDENDYNNRIIEEKTGFGWKGLGSRKIIFDNMLKDYRYEVIEPKLKKEEEYLKNKLIYLFRTRADLNDFVMNKNEMIEYLRDTIQDIIKENHIKLDADANDRIFYHIFRDFAGYGRIDILMHDEGIEDISCDGQGIPIFIFHKKYESILSNIIFDNGDELDSFVVKLSQMSGKQISVYEPVVDGKLSDGSRLQTTLARTITQHSTFTIRKFREDPLTPVDLIANNTMSVHMAAYFWMAIEQSSSVLFCGGTATGKTTMLNALSLFLPSAYKIVSIEDTREINLPHENWIAGTTRTGFSSSETTKTGKDIDMFDLVRIALRQRPKAIIVGEIRGREAYTLFQAMTTGHLSYSTIHASNLHALIQRLESPPISLPRVLLTSLDLVVFLNSVTVGGVPARRVTNATEILKLDPESNRLVTMTPFRWVSEIEDRFEYNGGSRILNRIKMQHGWSDDRLQQELNNRMVVLEWMRRKNLRSYQQVGKIVSEYHKDPESVLKRVKEDRL